MLPPKHQGHYVLLSLIKLLPFFIMSSWTCVGVVSLVAHLISKELWDELTVFSLPIKIELNDFVWWERCDSQWWTYREIFPTMSFFSRGPQQTSSDKQTVGYLANMTPSTTTQSPLRFSKPNIFYRITFIQVPFSIYVAAVLCLWSN